MKTNDNDIRPSLRTSGPDSIAEAVSGGGGGRWFWTAGVWLAIALFYLAAARPYFGLNSDAPTYLAGARSLATGHGYRFTSYPGMPPIGLYPPATSLLFTPVVWLCQDLDTQAMGCLIVLGIVTLVASGIGVGLLVRLGLPPWLAALGMLALATSPHWFLSVVSLGSDVPFTFFVWVACGWWLRHSETLTVRQLLVLGPLLLAAMLTRSAGLALFIGLIAAELLLNRDRARRTVPILVAFLLATSLLRRLIVPAGAIGYLPIFLRTIEANGGLQFYGSKIVENALSFLSGIQFHELLWPVLARSPQIASRISGSGGWILSTALLGIWIGVLMLMIVRALHQRRSRPGAIEVGTLLLVLGATVGMLVMLPIAASHFSRYLLWTFPLVVAALWKSIHDVVPTQHHRLVATAAGLVTCVVIASNAWVSFSILQKSIADHGLEEGRAFATEIRPLVGKDSSIATSGIVPFVHFEEWLGRPVYGQYYGYDLSTTPAGQWSDRAQNCAFVVIHPDDRLEEFADASGWKVLARSKSGKFTLYRTQAANR